MRLSIFFVVAFVANVLGQSTTEPDVFVTTIEPAPEPTAEPAPPPTSETPILTTPPATEISTTETTTPPPVSTSAPPSAGGATQTYLSIARTCFTDSACNADASQMAVQDYGTVCSATTTPADTSVSTRSTQPTSRTRTNTGSLASPTTKTLVFTSGAVVSISGGVSSTITSGFTSIRTGQAGDFATDNGLGPTAGIDGGPLNNGAPGVNVGHLASFGMMMGLGVAGGIVVLAL